MHVQKYIFILNQSLSCKMCACMDYSTVISAMIRYHTEKKKKQQRRNVNKRVQSMIVFSTKLKRSLFLGFAVLFSFFHFCYAKVIHLALVSPFGPLHVLRMNETETLISCKFAEQAHANAL